jgi:hypothetical protein
MTEKKRVGAPPGPRPHRWVTGPDPELRKQYYAWHRAKSQAHYREEEWLFTFEQYQAVWGLKWSQRGRGRDDLQMVRRDFLAAWEPSNVKIVARPEFTAKQLEIREYYKHTPRKTPRKVTVKKRETQ